MPDILIQNAAQMNLVYPPASVFILQKTHHIEANATKTSLIWGDKPTPKEKQAEEQNTMNTNN